MCESYNRQYGTQFVAVMPTNLYGPGDNFDLETSHVMPALIRKFHDAKEHGKPEVEVWGTGKPRREFLYVDDMADGCLFVMKLPDEKIKAELLDYPKPCFVNLGTGKDISIGELAQTVAEVVGYQGKIKFDTTKPDGTPQKLLDVARLNMLGWKPEKAIRPGILQAFVFYKESGRRLNN
jgi:GDP-L-fucose synthase